MALPFLMKLRSAGDRAHALDAEDRDALLSLCADVHEIQARRDIVREGQRPDHVNLMIEGWACRYKVVPDGSRQITALLLPGDFCDMHVTLFDRMDHSIAAITPCRVAFVPRERMRAITDRPRIARALWWAGLVDEAVLRSWIVNLGRRNAFDRIGHLICELHARLLNVGLVRGDTIDLPLTQEDLADATGLTSVHVNRTLRRLRNEGLIELDRRRLAITDVAMLRRRVGFDAAYLHLPGAAEPDDALPDRAWRVAGR